MDFPRSLTRKPYIDVMDIESIPNAVEEALRMLRVGIFRAMSSNLEEQRAKAAAAAAATSSANASASFSSQGLVNTNSASSHASIYTSRDPLSVYSAVTKRPRKNVTPDTSTNDVSSSQPTAASNPAAAASSNSSDAASESGDPSDTASSRKLMLAQKFGSSASQGAPGKESHTGEYDGKTSVAQSSQESRKESSDNRIAQANAGHDDDGADDTSSEGKMSVFQPSASREHRSRQNNKSEEPGKVFLSHAAVAQQTDDSSVTKVKPADSLVEALTSSTNTGGKVASLLGEKDKTNDAEDAMVDECSDHGKVEDSGTDSNSDVKTGVGTKRKASDSSIARDKKPKTGAVFEQEAHWRRGFKMPSPWVKLDSAKVTKELSNGSQVSSPITSDGRAGPSSKDDALVGAAESNFDKVQNVSKLSEKIGKSNGSLLSEKSGNAALPTSNTADARKVEKPGVGIGGTSKIHKASKAGTSKVGSGINPRVNLGTKVGKASMGAPKVAQVTEDVSGSIETMSGAAAAMAGASSGKRSGLKGISGTLMSLTGAKRGRISPAMALLRRKMSESSGGNSAHKGTPNGTTRGGPGASSEMGMLPKAQREMLAQRGGVLALGTHTVGHRGGGIDGKAPVAGKDFEAGPKRAIGAAGRSSKSEVQFVPGSQSINGVEPNGYVVSAKGEVLPKVTLAARLKVPIKFRQSSLERLFKAWKDDAKVSEADALQNCLKTEQEIYAGCTSHINYRAVMVGKLKEIRTATK